MQRASRPAFAKADKVRLEGKEPFLGVGEPSASLIGTGRTIEGRTSSGLPYTGHRTRSIWRSSHLQQMARKGSGYSKVRDGGKNRLHPALFRHVPRGTALRKGDRGQRQEQNRQ